MATGPLSMGLDAGSAEVIVWLIELVSFSQKTQYGHQEEQRRYNGQRHSQTL
jgi:hypothetical protein